MQRHGPYATWHPSGAKKEEGEYRDGLKHGRWTTWSNSGVNLAEGPYVYGRKQDLWTQWNQDGSKQEEAEFVADQRHGRFIGYRAGIKTSEVTYRHNFPNGHITMWHLNGQKSGEGDLRDSRPTGAFTAWHPTGQKMGEGRYSDQGPDGDFTFWDRQGNRRLVYRFMNGAQVALLAWDEYGRAIANAVEVHQHRDAYFDGHPNDFLMFMAILGGLGR